MPVITVKTDITGALRKFKLTKTEGRKAIQRAINKTGMTARANASQNIRAAGYNIKASAIKRALVIRRATGDELTAILRASGRPIPLIAYGARQSKSGVVVKVKNGQATIKHGFIATMPSGHRGVFVRVETEAQGRELGLHLASHGMSAGKSRHGLPIRQLFGPSIPAAFANETVREATIAAIHERFPVVLDQELNYLRMKLDGAV